MDRLQAEVNQRLDMGRSKYGHGVRISDNMTNYTRCGIDSFLEMQNEEILDGMVYTAASYLRWLRHNYGAKFEADDQNDDIRNIIFNGIHMNDIISQRYKKLLESMIQVYLDTKKLDNQIKDIPN